MPRALGREVLNDLLPGYPWGAAVEAYASGRGYGGLSAKDQQKLPRALSLIAAAWVQANGIDPFENAKVARALHVGIAGTVPDVIKRRMQGHFHTITFYEPKAGEQPKAGEIVNQAIENGVDLLVDVNGGSYKAGAYANAAMDRLRERALGQENPVDCLRAMEKVPLVVQANFDPKYEGNMYGMAMSRLDHHDTSRIGKLFTANPDQRVVEVKLPARDGYPSEQLLIVNEPPKQSPSGGRQFMCYTPPIERHLPLLIGARGVNNHAAVSLNGDARFIEGTDIRQSLAKILDADCVSNKGLDPVLMGLKAEFMRAIGPVTAHKSLVDDMVQTLEPAVMAIGMMTDDPDVLTLIGRATQSAKKNARTQAAADHTP